MPRFSGKQYKGAARDVAEARRLDANKRNLDYRARVKSEAPSDAEIDHRGEAELAPGLATKLLNVIFGDPTAAQRAGNASRHTRSRRNHRSDAEAHDLAAHRG